MQFPAPPTDRVFSSCTSPIVRKDRRLITAYDSTQNPAFSLSLLLFGDLRQTLTLSLPLSERQFVTVMHGF